jgi:hypothetical protein
MDKCTINHTNNKHQLSKDYRIFSTQISTQDSSFFKFFSEALTKERMCNENESVDSFGLEEEFQGNYNPLSDDHRNAAGTKNNNNKLMLNLNEITIDDNSLYSFENFYCEENNRCSEINNPIKNPNNIRKEKVVKSTEQIAMEKVKKEIESLKKLKMKNDKNLQKIKRNSLKNTKRSNNNTQNFLSKKRNNLINKTENDNIEKKAKVNSVKLKTNLNFELEMKNLNTKIENFSITPNKPVAKKTLEISLKSRNKSKQDINMVNPNELKGIELYKKNFHTMPNNKSKVVGELMKNQTPNKVSISLNKKPISRNSLNIPQRTKLQDSNY